MLRDNEITDLKSRVLHLARVSTYLKPLGRAIAKRRQELDKSQKEVAEGAGIAPLTLARIEHGKAIPRPKTLEKIAIQLETTPAKLVAEGESLPKQTIDGFVQDFERRFKELEAKVSAGATDLTLQEIKALYGDDFLAKLRKIASNQDAKTKIVREVDFIYKIVADDTP